MAEAADSRLLGFSAGCFYLGGAASATDPANFRAFLEAGADAVELADRGASILPDDPAVLDAFRWVSVHAPGPQDPAFFRRVMDESVALSRSRPLGCVVLHPCNFSGPGGWDFSPLAGYAALPLALENMDDRKATGRFPAEMAGAFEAADAMLGRRTGFVLDLSHVFQHDPTMGLAGELVEAFGDRLLEVHLSGHRDFHDQLSVTLQEGVVAAVPPGVPVIIESGLQERGHAAREISWISERLGR